MANTPAFDPFSQSFTLLTPDGPPIKITIPELDEFILYSIQISINYAAQLGASLLFLVVLLLLTKSEKKKSPVFIINSVALLLNLLRTLLQCLYFTGPFSETYAYFTLDYSRVSTSDYANQVAITVLTLLLLICAELSLLLQVHVVCITLRQIFQRLIFALSIIIAGLAVSFRLTFCIENAKYILALKSLFPLEWLASATNIVTSISICWFCAVFVIKLGFALNQRKKLGMGTFGPMRIIFIMGCQTLIIPAIFSILEYFVPLPSMDSNVLSLVVTFLPLSSLWASASIDNRKRYSAQPKFHGKLLGSDGSDGSAVTGPLVNEKFLIEPLSPSASATSKTSHLSLVDPTNATHGRVDVDLEAQRLAEFGDQRRHQGRLNFES
ncbi:MAG: hypothetical protein L6R37_000945 [Teloschistes peruensis]|nr:MAG: hypothetical protein L6R37_000945 [Teloschistes peruensis]